MLSRVSRSGWLIIFAICNLVFWVVAAVAVGLLASDEVDLGVETLIRQRQATAALVWEQVVSRSANPTAEPTMVVQAPAPVASTTASAPPVTSAVAPPGSTPLPASSGQIDRNPAPSPPKKAPPPLPQSTAQHQEKLVSSPLLMRDLELGNLAQMDREMSRSASGRPVQLSFTEATLNHEIETLLRNNPELPYRSVHVDLRRDQGVVTGVVTVLGFEVNTEVVGTVEARDCQPHLQIESISILGVLTPGLIEEQVKALILEALDWYPDDYPLCLEQIILEEDRATVYGYRR